MTQPQRGHCNLSYVRSPSLTLLANMVTPHIGQDFSRDDDLSRRSLAFRLDGIGAP
jgi:hypothetical protein